MAKQFDVVPEEELGLNIEKLFQSYVPGGLLLGTRIKEGRLIFRFKRRPRK